MIRIQIDTKQAKKAFGLWATDLQKKQLPFAMALALTRTAQLVQQAETANLPEVFDRPTPFTMKAIGMQKATKSKLESVIFVKDIQAGYLKPYIMGGLSVPAKPANIAMLRPKAIDLNQYGNIPANKIKKLLGNKDKYFLGTVTFKKTGKVTGLWERVDTGTIGHKVTWSERGQKWRHGTVIKGEKHNLKLLMRFGDPKEVKQHFAYFKNAEAIVKKNFDIELKKAMKQAIATAR